MEEGDILEAQYNEEDIRRMVGNVDSVKPNDEMELIKTEIPDQTF